MSPPLFASHPLRVNSEILKPHTDSDGSKRRNARQGKCHILGSLEILAVLGVLWDLALQDLRGLQPRQGVQVAPGRPFQPVPLGGPENQPDPVDLSLPADLQTVITHFCF